MAKRVIPLTNTQVKQAKESDKEYTLSDGDGLQLRIKTNGTKLWILKYTHPITKKRTNISFGSYPDVPLAEARKRRADAKKLIAHNIDPKQHKDEQLLMERAELENTFGKLADKWLELKKESVKPETAEKAYRALEKHILPKLANFPIQDIKPKLVLDILAPVKAQGSLETVKRLCRIINEVMRLAVASGHIEVNYLADITKLFPAPKRKHMATIRPERLPELMQAIANANITLSTRCLLEWQLHTMTRPIESATARWQDIDFENRVWIVPEERMKMKRPHTIPLTEQTLALLDIMKPISSHRGYIFPSNKNPKSHVNSQSANMALKRMGFDGELVSHGLRALASTTLNEQGFNPDVIEAALAHVDRNDVRKAYNRAEYLEQRRKLMCWWSEHITVCAEGNMSLAGKKGLKLVV
ncbi:integrase domain-containing protein [Vibrio coralliilyticus]|uniref:Tyrosine-type recombinase/integrase n=1 Tax=Vibrio coralliilyticus TaxID=190893 RepID=A0AAP6ZK98_9VIBR|nr:integrase domain-containing protein [Vibrio coralliilyticus]NOJ23224.1 tyrosine-type recombinase/integrase [Vibrio coralliilyticus]